MTRSPYTPSVGGYAVGILVSWGVFVIPFLALGPYVVFAIVGVVILGTPIGILGMLATHLVCRNDPLQADHVVVAALSGLFLVVVPGLWLSGGEGAGWYLLLGTWVAVCAAVGRAVAGPRPRRVDSGSGHKVVIRS